MSLQEIVEALAASLDGITGLRVYPHVPGALSPPAAIVQLPRTIDFDLTFARGADTYLFPVMVLVGAADDRAAHINLARFLDASGPSSIKAALDGDLGGKGDVEVKRATGVGSYSVGGIDYAGATLEVEVVV